MSNDTTILTSHLIFFFFNDTATTEIYTLSLHDALPIFYRDAHTPQIVEAVRISRQPRPHHDDLRQSPRLIEQLVLRGAILRIRQEHHVGLAGGEVRHALVALTKADLYRHAGFARQGAHQMDVETLRLALIIQVLVRGELAIAPIHNRAARRRGRLGEQVHG